MIDIENAKKVLKQYVSGYNLKDGKIALKYAHILRVAELSKKIASNLKLSEEDIELAELIGMLHDIGRFEQIRIYNTFVDKNSINHGQYGAKILFEDGLIEKFNIDKKYYKIIKIAIINHNKAKIEDGLTEKEILHSKIIRDSDKLDIFYVLITDTTENIYGCTKVQLSNSTFSNEFVKQFKSDNHLLDYKYMETFGDHWLSQIDYVFDFNFKSSYEILKPQDYLNKLLKKANFKDPKTLETAKELVKIGNDYIDEILK